MPNDAAADSMGKEASGPAAVDFESLPALYRDPACWGFTAAQFLGALNDTVFKQIVLLLLVKPVDRQWVAQEVFALPFVLLSGAAGFLADRVSKRSIIVACKIAEICIMFVGVAAFWATGNGFPWALVVVLFLMGIHSSVFGPSKYGILPEMVRGRDLPRFNGLIQMTTFLALILGVPVAGFLLDEFQSDLWKAGCVCLLIAALGTASSLAIRRTPVAQPNARFGWANLAIDAEMFGLLRRDRPLRMALLVYSVFWFVAALVPLSVNGLGTRILKLNNMDTSLMVASIAIGIAFGCILAGRLSAERVNFGLVRLGCCGLVVCLFLLSLPGWGTTQEKADAKQGAAPKSETAAVPQDTAVTQEDGVPQENMGRPHLLGYRGSQVVLAIAGIFTGLFAVPIQVYLQAQPPDALKGRMIGTMNLFNWVGIMLSARYYHLCHWTFDLLGLPEICTFAAAALMLLPVALFYRPRDVALK